MFYQLDESLGRHTINVENLQIVFLLIFLGEVENIQIYEGVSCFSNSIIINHHEFIRFYLSLSLQTLNPSLSQVYMDPIYH